MASTYLDVASLKAYLRIKQADSVDDALLASIVEAVEAQQYARLVEEAFTVIDPAPAPPAPPVTVPADVYQAALMRGARLYVRRASPEGLVGLGELGVARVPPYDKDIDALEAPWRKMVLA